MDDKYQPSSPTSPHWRSGALQSSQEPEARARGIEEFAEGEVEIPEDEDNLCDEECPQTFDTEPTVKFSWRKLWVSIWNDVPGTLTTSCLCRPSQGLAG